MLGCGKSQIGVAGLPVFSVFSHVRKSVERSAIACISALEFKCLNDVAAIIMSTAMGTTITLDQLKLWVNEPALASEHLLSVLMSLRSGDEETRAWASDVLSSIEQPPACLAAKLAELTLDGSAPVAGWACKLLGRMGPTATIHQASIVQSLSRHPEITVQQLAALALGTIPQLTPEAVQALREASSRSDPRLSRLAKQSLQAQGL